MLAECKNHKGQLFYQEIQCISKLLELQLQWLQDYYDPVAAGHLRNIKTFEILSRNIYWPKMREIVKQYVQNCNTCYQSKTSKHVPYCVLHPLLIIEKSWEDLSLDFVTELPKDHDFDTIMVVVEQLSKMWYLIPCWKYTTTANITQLFLQNI